MQERQTAASPFQNRLSALAQMAMREAGADGCAFFIRIPNVLALIRQEAYGCAITEDLLNGHLDPLGCNLPVGDRRDLGICVS